MTPRLACSHKLHIEVHHHLHMGEHPELENSHTVTSEIHPLVGHRHVLLPPSQVHIVPRLVPVTRQRCFCTPQIPLLRPMRSPTLSSTFFKKSCLAPSGSVTYLSDQAAATLLFFFRFPGRKGSVRASEKASYGWLGVS